MIKENSEKCCKHELKRKILENINQNPKIKKTKLMVKVNTSHESLDNYLKILIDNKMIIENKLTDKERFKVTKKGLNYLSLLNSLRRLESE